MSGIAIPAFPGQDQSSIIVACPATNLSGQRRLKLPATEWSEGPEIGVPRRRMVLALGSHGLQLWKANWNSKPQFHAGSIPEDFITAVDTVTDHRRFFGHDELLLQLGDGTKLRLATVRKHRDEVQELAMRLARVG